MTIGVHPGITHDTLLAEAAGLLSEDGENPEYDRAIVELVTRLLPGFNHDDHATVLNLIHGHQESHRMTRPISIVFRNEDGNPVSHYEIGPDTVRLEQVPTNDGDAWVMLAGWIIANRPEAFVLAAVQQQESQ